MQTYTEADIRRNISVLRDEAARTRRWAVIRRQEAAAEDERAKQLDSRVAELEAMLPGLPERSERTERRHAKAAGAAA